MYYLYSQSSFTSVLMEISDSHNQMIHKQVEVVLNSQCLMSHETVIWRGFSDTQILLLRTEIIARIISILIITEWCEHYSPLLTLTVFFIEHEI